MCLAFTLYVLFSSLHAIFLFPASLALLHAGFQYPAPILVVLLSHHADFHSLRLYCLAYHFIIQASSFRLTIQSSDPLSFPITHHHAHNYSSHLHLILTILIFSLNLYCALTCAQTCTLLRTARFICFIAPLHLHLC